MPYLTPALPCLVCGPTNTVGLPDTNTNTNTDTGLLEGYTLTQTQIQTQTQVCLKGTL